MYQLIDFVTRKSVSTDNFVFTGKTHPWEVEMDLDLVRSRINQDYFRSSPPFVSKYLPLLPISNYESFISLKEGATPLVASRILGRRFGINLSFKLESRNPTGSFKDRGSAVELTIAKEFNAKGIVVASTGNMAASCCCYAASAKIPCFVFVPEDTPSSKLSQAISYGGRIVQVKGSYNDAARLAREVALELGFYLAGDYAFRVEGAKTAAFELVDQLLYQVPDIVIVPMGCGTNMAGYLKGFREYKALGFIDRIPQLIGVQATGACPIVNSFLAKEKNITPIKNVNTIASAIAVGDPLDGLKALDALYSTDGLALAVSDREMLEAQYSLSHEEGLFVESSCAACIAALQKLTSEKKLGGKHVVCVLTGDGLKDPNPILKVALKPPTIYPELKEFLVRYNNKFFDGQTFVFIDKGDVVFGTTPSLEEIEKTLFKYFQISYPKQYTERIRDTIAKFLVKGKPVTFADLQDIVQDVLETLTGDIKRLFTVLDFTVDTGKDRQATAKVTVQVDGDTLKGNGSGVGPVDAVINALKTACGSKMQFALAGYKVDIRSQGTDAVVYVELKLIKDNVVSLGKGTSPDIIQASIEAFESAYNGFYS